MGVDTKLFLNSSVGLDELKGFIESDLDTKITIQGTHTPTYQTWQFDFEDTNRSLNVHLNSKYGGFSGTLLSFASNDQGKRIMKAIADVFGGFFQAEDGDGIWEDFSGTLAPENGLPYFLRYGILRGADSKSLIDLKEVIKTWEKEVKSDHQIEGMVT